ncbi:hypothetical protein D3C77_448160 [compost metagenome]
MRVPGSPCHQQHWLMLQLTQGTGHIQGVGHHHQAGLMAKLGNHRRGGTATVDDDAGVFADTPYRSLGNGLLVEGDGLALIGKQLLRQGHRAAVATQQQAVGLQCREILADGHFRSLETLGQGVDTHLALFIEQGENVVAALGRVSFRHGMLKFRSER